MEAIPTKGLITEYPSGWVDPSGDTLAFLSVVAVRPAYLDALTQCGGAGQGGKHRKDQEPTQI